MSEQLFNKSTRLAIVCPITNSVRDLPFHVDFGDDPDVTGFVMVEQVKSIDFRTRGVRRTGRAADELLPRSCQLSMPVSVEIATTNN